MTMTPSMISLYSIHLESKVPLTANIHFQLSHLNRLCTEEVDLLKFKRTDDLPSWYPVFQIPYQVKAKDHCSVHIALIKLIYVNKSQDPESFSPYV